MPHIAGKKLSRRHTTVIDAAKSVVAAARALDCVSKVSLGLIRQVMGNPVAQRLKIEEITAGLKIVVRGPKTIQELFVYTADPQATRQVLEQHFASKKGKKGR